MKKFIDKTNSLKEPAIKTGNSVPRDAVNLGWFSSKDISPENNMIITDLSSLITENINPQDQTEKIMFANELGILEDENGISDIDSDEVYISNIFLDENVRSQDYSPSSLASKNYAMSYYVSNYFTLVTNSNFIDLNLTSFTDQKYIPNNIQVLDSNGDHYVDLETGRKKYRIELESFVTTTNYNSNEVPTKIVVFLEDPNPTNFSLVYDKVEVDEDGKWFSQILKYKETINSIALFKLAQEEAETIDPYNSDKDIFSIKRSSKERISNRSFSNNDSKKIFVNKKAIEDNRDFQIFNWRIVGRIKSSVNLNEINYGNDFTIQSKGYNDVKVGVLYSSLNLSNAVTDSSSLSKIKPYVFYNLENSPFNLSGMNLVNPYASVERKASAEYWLVDIDTISEEQIKQYDVLSCALHWRLTSDQCSKISRFTENYGSILFDISQAENESLLGLDSNFAIQNTNTFSPPSISQSYNSDNQLINQSLNNAFNISTSIFAQDCGIYGYAKIRNQYRSYRYFTGNSFSSVLSINGEKIVVNKRVTNPGDSHRASNIVASTAPMLDYANVIYPADNVISSQNASSSAVGVTSNSTFSVYSEGPLKFLYNFVSVALNDKMESSRRSQTLNSTVHYFTTQWKNDWVIDGDVLFEDEKSKYFKNQTVNAESKLVREMTSNPRSLYIKELQTVIPGIRETFLDQNDSNIDLFIEFTNPNIAWTNATQLSSSDQTDLASSYNVVKVSNKVSSCSVYSLAKSNPFTIPSGFGAFSLKDKSKNSQENIFGISPVSQIKNYNFDLNVSHKKTVLSDGPNYFSAQATVQANVKFKQTKNSLIRTDQVKKPDIKVPGAVTTSPGKDEPVSASGFVTSQESSASQKQLKDISNVLNVYSYTGDIEAGNSSKSYSNGSTGDYVRYIQFTLSCAGIKTTIDSSFGSSTAANVRTFQSNNGILSDGVVDSQTKMYLGLYWAGLSAQEYSDKFNLVKNDQVKKYITAARETRTAANALNNNLPVKLINFTAITDQKKDPDQAVVWISFKLPDGDNVKQIQKVQIDPIGFGSLAGPYNGIQILDYEFGSSPTTRSSNQQRFIDRSDKLAPLVINIYSAERKGQWISIKVKGSPLGGSFGNTAEGIAIGKITTVYRTPDVTTQGPETSIPGGFTSVPVWEDVTKDIEGIVTATINYPIISTSSVPVNVDKNFLLTNGRLKSISVYRETAEVITNDLIPYENLTNVSLNQTSYKPSSGPETINLSDLRDIVVTSASLVSGSVKESGNANSAQYSNSLVQVSLTGNTVSAKNDILAYSNPNSYFQEEKISNYFLKSDLTGEIRPGTNVVNYYDGVTLITKNDGSPYMMNLSNITTQVAGSASVYYSDIELSTNLADEPGLKYGFYNNLTKKFLGRKISYSDYRQNAANTYIALYAYDYDGNLDSIADYTSSNQETYSPAIVPGKVAYPIFKIKTSNKNKIQLLQTQPNLDKTQTWPITLTSGSFYKDIDLSSIQFPMNWISSYRGEVVSAKYDTSSIESVAPSKLFGTGYYDIIDETPIIIDRYTIQARQQPIHFIHEPASDPDKFGNKFTPIISVYTREDENSEWVKVSSTIIQDVNSKNGIIKLSNPIISSDESLTKISYTVRLNSVMVKHVNGDPIPTNPFLNRDTVKINKPLYIYLLPKELYKYSVPTDGLINATVVSKQLIEEYSSSSTIGYTYNNNIFNKSDSFHYNPLALLIGIVYVVNNFRDEDFSFTDLRTKGGGVSANFDTNKIIDDIEEAISYWDVYPPMSEAYPKGGYVIVKIPKEVKKNFTNPDEVYTIVRDNITAGIVFDLQDMDGKDWGSSVTISS